MLESYARAEAVVTTEWVAQHVSDPDVVVAEVDTDLHAEYAQGHVPGAVGWSLHNDMEDPVRRDVPGRRQLAALLGKSGVENATTVVLYGDGNNRSATWAFWVLKYYRHEDLRLMNGGKLKWIAEGRPLTSEIPPSVEKTYRMPEPDTALRATREYVLEHLDNPSTRFLDTRTYEEFAGLLTSAPGTPQPDIYRKGRIPGAIHVPWDDGAQKDGAFKSAAELAAMYEAAGLTADQEMIPYCRLGVRASYSWFVLKYLLGYPDVRNYDGSWTEWGNSVGVPIETDVTDKPA